MKMTDEEKRVKKKVYQKEYNKVYMKDYYSRRPEIREKQLIYSRRPEIKEKKKAYYLRRKLECLEYQRIYLLQKKYGLTVKAFEVMLAGQGGVCAACGSDKWGARGPVVDHSHKTGKVRGILCSRCNLFFGQIEDNSQVLQAMLDYLERV